VDRVCGQQFTFSCSMLVAPMIVLATFHRLLHQASASCVGVSPCRSATRAYSATASRASDLLYLARRGRRVRPAAGRRSRRCAVKAQHAGRCTPACIPRSC